MLICGLISHHRASVHCTGYRLRTAGLVAPLQHVLIAIPYSTEGISDEEVKTGVANKHCKLPLIVTV